jgi:hypothetical protein
MKRRGVATLWKLLPPTWASVSCKSKDLQLKNIWLSFEKSYSANWSPWYCLWSFV